MLHRYLLACMLYVPISDHVMFSLEFFSRFQSRSPCPAERETRDSGMTRFLSWVQLRRRKRLDKMATNAHKVFHEFSVTKLGNPNLELKKEQHDVIRTIYLEKRDVLTVLPTGVGKSICYQALPAIFDFYGKRR